MIDTLRRLVALNGKVFFFALAITSGIYIAISELHRFGNDRNFFVFSIALLFIFLIEIYSNWYFETIVEEHRLIKRERPLDKKHLLHLILLPIALYISLIGYGYYNLESFSLGLVLISTLLIFFILFVNMRAFFRHEVKKQHRTNYVFDIIKFLVFFTTVNIIANLTLEESEYRIFFALLVGVLASVILFLMLWRLEKVHIFTLAYNLIGGIMAGALFYILGLNGSFNALEASLVLVTTFYVMVALLHHKLENSINREVLFEYSVVLLLVISLAYGIN